MTMIETDCIKNMTEKSSVHKAVMRMMYAENLLRIC